MEAQGNLQAGCARERKEGAHTRGLMRTSRCVLLPGGILWLTAPAGVSCPMQSTSWKLQESQIRSVCLHVWVQHAHSVAMPTHAYTLRTHIRKRTHMRARTYTYAHIYAQGSPPSTFYVLRATFFNNYSSRAPPHPGVRLMREYDASSTGVLPKLRMSSRCTASCKAARIQVHTCTQAAGRPPCSSMAWLICRMSQ